MVDGLVDVTSLGGCCDGKEEDADWRGSHKEGLGVGGRREGLGSGVARKRGGGGSKQACMHAGRQAGGRKRGREGERAGW